ncbi:unnamed protein product, partial [Prorocentrum cordatum]
PQRPTQASAHSYPRERIARSRRGGGRRRGRGQEEGAGGPGPPGWQAASEVRCTPEGWGERRTGGRGRGRRAGENAQDRLRPRAGRGPGRGRGEKRICREREQQQEEQEGVAAAAQQGPRRRLAAAAQKMMSSSFFVLSSALGTSRADTGAGIARPLASSSFLSAIFSRSIFAFFFSTTFLTLKNSSRSISSISCVMYWMVSSMRGIRTYCRAFTRRLVILISSSRVLKAHCNEASLIRATIDLK